MNEGAAPPPRRLGIVRIAALSAAFALAIAAGAAERLSAEGQIISDERVLELLAIFAAGAFLAGAAALLATRLVLPRAGLALRAFAILTLTALGTIVLQGAIYGFHFYLNAYGEHEPMTRLVGWFQLAFTSAQGTFYYAVFGLRLMWPWGIAALLGFVLLSAHPSGD